MAEIVNVLALAVSGAIALLTIIVKGIVSDVKREQKSQGKQIANVYAKLLELSEAHIQHRDQLAEHEIRIKRLEDVTGGIMDYNKAREGKQ